MSAKKLIIFFVVLLQVAVLAASAVFYVNGSGPEIFIYFEAGLIALCLGVALLVGFSMSFGQLFFAFGGFAHLVLTLAVTAATVYYATQTDDFLFIGLLAGCSLLLILSLIPMICRR